MLTVDLNTCWIMYSVSSVWTFAWRTSNSLWIVMIKIVLLCSFIRVWTLVCKASCFSCMIEAEIWLLWLLKKIWILNFNVLCFFVWQKWGLNACVFQWFSESWAADSDALFVSLKLSSDFVDHQWNLEF